MSGKAEYSIGVVALLLVQVSTFLLTGCKPCHKCEALPSEVTQLQGEWEWIYTQRQFVYGQFQLYDDTITQGQIGAVVTLKITDDGCLKFSVNEEDHHVCMDVYNFRNKEDTIPYYHCSELITMNLDGKDFTTSAFAEVWGTDCSNMNTLEGLIVPFSVQRSYLEPPPQPPGLELSSYKNHFVRIR